MKILIVEDDHTATELMIKVAKLNGYEDVDTAGSAEDALALAINKSYDLITLDVQLPGASGLEVLSVIRNMCPHAIIAVISAHFPGDVPFDAAECADVMLDKPVPVKKLAQLMNSSARICEEMTVIRSLEEK